MKPPIILNESSRIEARGDLSIWRSAKEAQDYVEPIDVENGEYFAFDAEGRLLRLETNGQSVWLVGAETEPTHQPTVRGLLTDLLVLGGMPELWCQQASFDEIVVEAAKRYERLPLEPFKWIQSLKEFLRRLSKR